MYIKTSRIVILAERLIKISRIILAERLIKITLSLFDETTSNRYVQSTGWWVVPKAKKI